MPKKKEGRGPDVSLLTLMDEVLHKPPTKKQTIYVSYHTFGPSSPLVKNNPLYRNCDYLINRAARKLRCYKKRSLQPEEARCFVMPYGQYMGYYLATIEKHDPSYVTWLWNQLKSAKQESAYDGDVTITAVIRALRWRARHGV